MSDPTKRPAARPRPRRSGGGFFGVIWKVALSIAALFLLAMIVVIVANPGFSIVDALNWIVDTAKAFVSAIIDFISSLNPEDAITDPAEPTL